MDIFTFHTAWTVIAVSIFTAVVWWAINPKNKSFFDDAASIPMLDEKGEKEQINDKEEGVSHG